MFYFYIHLTANQSKKEKAMPLVIKDYRWEETPTTVAISVPLKGVKKNKVDLFSTDEFLKAGFSCELLL